MGFPDTFKIPVSDTRAYKQFGNSVVVPAVKSLAIPLVQRVAAAQRRKRLV
jgi:DNA (cytosine-5)-methyltransferase 1